MEDYWDGISEVKAVMAVIRLLVILTQDVVWVLVEVLVI